MRISARYKISYHKRTGPWTNPEKCKRCESGERPPASTSIRSPSRLTENKRGAADKLPLGREIKVYKVIGYDQHSPKQQEHFEAHIPGAPFSKVQSGKSPTSLVPANATSQDLFLAAALKAVQTTRIIRQYRDIRHGKGTIVNITMGHGSNYEVTIISPLDILNTACKLITTFDGVSENKIKEKIAKKHWI